MFVNSRSNSRILINNYEDLIVNKSISSIPENRNTARQRNKPAYEVRVARVLLRTRSLDHRMLPVG